MPEEPVTDDQSHYEISLTAGQAFIAFVLLLLSLAASFAFGLLIGKGQGDERLVVRKEPPVVTEASMTSPKKSDSGRIVELGVNNDDFKPPVKSDATTTTTAPPPVVQETPAPPAATTETTATVAPAPEPAATPVVAQLLSTSDQKTAEALAVKLINGGFTTARVEKGSTEKGTIFRVRIPFKSESEARAAEGKLREFSKDVWITK